MVNENVQAVIVIHLGRLDEQVTFEFIPRTPNIIVLFVVSQDLGTIRVHHNQSDGFPAFGLECPPKTLVIHGFVNDKLRLCLFAGHHFNWNRLLEQSAPKG